MSRLNLILFDFLLTSVTGNAAAAMKSENPQKCEIKTLKTFNFKTKTYL